MLGIFHPSIAHAISACIKCPFVRRALSQTCRAGRKYYYDEGFKEKYLESMRDLNLVIEACETYFKCVPVCQSVFYNPVYEETGPCCFKKCETYHKRDIEFDLCKHFSDQRTGRIPIMFLEGEMCKKFGCNGSHDNPFIPMCSEANWMIIIDHITKTWFIQNW